MQAFGKLSIEKEFSVHKNAGFFKALIKKKKHCKRGKNVVLFSKNESSQAMFFFQTRLTLLEVNNSFWMLKKSKKSLIKSLKLKLGSKRRNEKLKKFKNAKNRGFKKQLDKETKSFQKQAIKQLRLEEQTQKHRRLQSTGPDMCKYTNAPVVEPEVAQTKLSRSGRSIAVPTRFRD